MLKLRILTAVAIAAVLTACGKSEPPAAQVRPVRTVTVEHGGDGETVSLTGHIRAKDQLNLAFRLDGRMIERPVNVGEMVTQGQAVARLDPLIQENVLRAAQAAVFAAQAQLTQARLDFLRQQELVKDAVVPRAKFDAAQQAFLSAQAQVASTQAQLHTAQEQLGFTTLAADAPGVVTAVGAKSEDVVRAGQMVVQVARNGGRDATFDVAEQLLRTAPRDPLVAIVLTDDPTVKATGHVREVAPQADATTRTFQVKVTIVDPPVTMRLGATVTGSIKLAALPGLEVPASALTEATGNPAVWVVDPKSQTVSLRRVDVLRYEPASVVIAQGLEKGDVVVTAGVQTLHPGQKVRRLEVVS